MNQTYFVTGTDTEVGKTFVSAALLTALNEHGFSTLGLKPIAAGCEQIDGQWKNEDALILQKVASRDLPYELVNPIALPDAIAPHLAAENHGCNLSVKATIAELQKGLSEPSDITLIEGAGGWYVPLNSTEFFSDFAVTLSLPVILVVGVRLGCINHALLTVGAIQQSGLRLSGWVANCIDPKMSGTQQNICTLKRSIEAPCLGVIPHLTSASPTDAAAFLDVGSFL
ncbi:MAG: dethiobiotin synthase [Gammaproteobacteria bacterium]|nr:dethiobiotin synthase [Gammaproteobacteria bacterium]